MATRKKNVKDHHKRKSQGSAEFFRKQRRERNAARPKQRRVPIEQVTDNTGHTIIVGGHWEWALGETRGGCAMNDWIPVSAPNTVPENVVVETKIDDEYGIRNQTTLKRIRNLWFFPDGSMYVYYNPTHWRPVSD